jgi:phospholipase C
MRRAFALVLIALLLSWAVPGPVRAGDGRDYDRPEVPKTATPIKHIVVIFDENQSFDHYFGTYPVATNPPNEPRFEATPGTPGVNGLSPDLLSNNPSKTNATTNPFRLDRSQAATCDNDNHYSDEQQAFDSGLLDRFNVTSVTASCGDAFYFVPGLAMGYYDGNTVTALWNYAQHFAISDNFFDTEFGTTVMGHLNLISGQTHGSNSPDIAGKIVNGSVIVNVDPQDDDCPGSAPNVTMTGKNVGDLLTAAKVTWGWFYADFTATQSGGKAVCSSIYNPHYDPFQYYASTANPHHLPPGSISAIGTNADQANHQYDMNSFWEAVQNGNLPAVSFLKASVPSTGHPEDSSPLEEQAFLVKTINQLEASPYWQDTAILIAYDDSDGWYDHVMPPIINPSSDPVNDGLVGSPKTSTGSCGTPLPGAYEDRCGFGERLPFVVISPYAKRNYVDHTLNDTTSILRFIEQNWNLGTLGDPESFDVLASGSIMGMFDFTSPLENFGRVLFLDPSSGQRIGGEW